MATFRLNQFSAPRVLQSIDRTRLLTFLLPFRTFFAARGVALPHPGSPDLVAYTWNAIFLPKSAPADIVKKLRARRRARTSSQAGKAVRGTAGGRRASPRCRRAPPR